MLLAVGDRGYGQSRLRLLLLLGNASKQLFWRKRSKCLVAVAGAAPMLLQVAVDSSSSGSGLLEGGIVWGGCLAKR